MFTGGHGAAQSLQLALAVLKEASLGGAHSLALTILRPDSLLTGKNTGNFKILTLRIGTAVL